LVSQKILSISMTMPSPGGQTLRDVQPQNCCDVGQVGRVWHPAGLPKRATTRQPGGQSCTTHDTSPVEGCPPSWRVVGLRQTDGMPHVPSIKDRQ
jgi:hypothetical protein